jgi:PST family polysaccharide transporter
MAAAEYPETLFQRTTRALKWNYLGNAVRALAQLIIGVVLARLLGPEAFGTIAIASLMVSVGMLFADLGFGAALIQRDQVSDRDVRFIFTLQTCCGAALTILGVAASGVIAALFRRPEAASILRAMSLLFVLQSFGQTALAMLRRSLDFRAAQTINMISYVVPYALVGIPCAYLGWGAWSLVAAQLLQAALSSLLALRRSRIPVRPTFSATSGGLLAFGGKVVGSNLSSWSISNLDSVIIGRALGTVDLGLYSRALTLVATPMNAITTGIQGVLFAACSRAQTDVPRLRRAYLGATLLIASICLPVFVTISVVPYAVIRGLLGDRWIAAAPALPPLALSMAVVAVLALAGPVLTAMNRVAIELRAQAVTLALMVPVLYLTARYSITAVAWGVLVVCVVRLLLLVAPLLDLLRTSWTEALTVFTWPAVCAAAVAFPTWATDRLLSDIPPLQRLLAVAGVAAVSTVVAARLVGRGALRSPHGEFLLAPGRIPAAVNRFLRL